MIRYCDDFLHTDCSKIKIDNVDAAGNKQKRIKKK